MKRRNLLVEQGGIKYIGKEASEIEETEILGVSEDTYVEYRLARKEDDLRAMQILFVFEKQRSI
jgi:hypothetical protein